LESDVVPPSLQRERRRARAFGFCSLLLCAALGMGLESAHAFKLASYLDHPLRRELLLWAHAHGVGLALIVLTCAADGVLDEASARAAGRLRVAAVLMPLGFALSVLGHAESDPGPAIWLVPLGALALLSGLFQIARSALRS
jgi:hypothetical protein